jgi:hypothetical protein
MLTTQKSKYLLLVGAVIISLSTLVSASMKVNATAIPTLDDAKIFADFSDSTPAVLNYFTASSQVQVIDFYKQSYGEAVTQETKRGRLTLTYKKEDQAIRVVISEQDNKRQVDVIIEVDKN